MPTKAEFQELIDNCNVVWTADYNGTGVAGCIFTSKVNGNSVFFPAAGICGNSYVQSVGSDGHYWSVSYSWYESSHAYFLLFSSSRGQYLSDTNRFYGFPVRGVCK